MQREVHGRVSILPEKNLWPMSQELQCYQQEVTGWTDCHRLNQVDKKTKEHNLWLNSGHPELASESALEPVTSWMLLATFTESQNF